MLALRKDNLHKELFLHQYISNTGRKVAAVDCWVDHRMVAVLETSGVDLEEGRTFVFREIRSDSHWLG